MRNRPATTLKSKAKAKAKAVETGRNVSFVDCQSRSRWSHHLASRRREVNTGEVGEPERERQERHCEVLLACKCLSRFLRAGREIGKKNIFDMSVTHDKPRQSYCKQLKAGRACVCVFVRTLVEPFSAIQIRPFITNINISSHCAI